MKISRVTLKNYRGFKELNLLLDPKLTVIIGINGCGKTTIVNAIRLLLWSYIRNFKQDLRRGSIPSLKIDDVHQHNSTGPTPKYNYPCYVQGKLDFSEGDDFEFSGYETDIEDEFDLVGCMLQSETSRPKWLEGSFADLDAAKKRMDIAFEDLNRLQGVSDEFVPLPLVACYGTNRLWRRSAGVRKVNRTTSRYVGYDGAVSDTSNFLKFQWFIFYLVSHVPKTKAAALWIGVQEAIRSISGWNIKLPRPGDDYLLLTRGNEMMKLSQLGDGVRCMIGLVGDLACRCALLNISQGKDAVKKATGIVLIDEIDLHLHPEWQQTILAQLQEAFPRIQFIVTTHSPQVLSTVHRENIRVFERNGQGQLVVSEPMGQTYGEPSGDVLQSVMMVDPQPPVAEKADLQYLTELVDNGRYDEPDTKNLMGKLNVALGEQHPQLQKLRRSIARQRMLGK